MAENYEKLGVHIDSKTQAVHTKPPVLCSVLWEGSTFRAGNTHRRHKPIREGRLRMGCKLDTMQAVVERRRLKPLLSIQGNPDHAVQPSWTGRRIQGHCHRHTLYVNSVVSVQLHKMLCCKPHMSSARFVNRVKVIVIATDLTIYFLCLR